MLHDAHEVAVGDTVYLFPHTKTAGRICHEQKTVKIGKAPSAHWPMVLVTWEEDRCPPDCELLGEPTHDCLGTKSDRWQLVHKDDIKKRAAKPVGSADKRQGDGQTSGMGKWAPRVRVMPGKIKPIDLAEGEEQGTLF